MGYTVKIEQYRSEYTGKLCWHWEVFGRDGRSLASGIARDRSIARNAAWKASHRCAA